MHLAGLVMPGRGYTTIMLKLAASLLNQPVLSLRSGGPVAVTQAMIINPNNLKIEGFYCVDRFDGSTLMLLPQDIRDIIGRGFVINDHEVLAPPEDLVRLKELMDLDFHVIGKPVVTTAKRRLGKVNDFAADSETLYIQKLYVGQSLLKSFTGGQLSIDRDQVVEISNRHILIQDPLQGTHATEPATA